MKRLITLLVVLLISIMPAMAEFTPYDYHIMYTANGNYVVYDFPDIMLYLPIEWEDAITVEQTDTGQGLKIGEKQLQNSQVSRQKQGAVYRAETKFRTQQQKTQN